MRNLRFIVSYDGTAYSGFQRQPGCNTIQGNIETAIEKLTGERVTLNASGRTDAGVHARGQVFNVLTESKIPVQRWCLALNMWLPRDIILLHAEEVPLEFHSRFEAKRKTYCYTIRTGRFRDVFQQNFQFHHHARLDVEAMRQGLACLEGEHNFTSFCSIRTKVESRVRTLYEVRMEAEEYEQPAPYPQGQVIRIFITGNGFLYNMVRIIVGTLLQVGVGKRPYTDIPLILESQDRSKAGPVAEAHGLTLWSVEY